ncbi:MAG: winged helix-turn-helix transcriptional regulator, partial [Rhodospirillaceae bacterium]|nr:winged helix-turn-helix transcriptional regulator [Rhodospirillaceae bacterium]
MQQLDAIDKKILGALQKDGRMSLAEISVLAGLSPSPCLRRIKIMEKAGIIARYVAVLDQAEIGLPVSVF